MELMFLALYDLQFVRILINFAWRIQIRRFQPDISSISKDLFVKEKKTAVKEN